MPGYAAVVLAGGAARRLGGVDKPALAVGGRPMLHRVLAAVCDASPRIVVGPAAYAVADTLQIREDPPGGGPVAAAAAGLTLVPPGTPEVALLAADLPFLTPDTIQVLRRAATGPARRGAVLLDDTDRPQWLCGLWQVDALRARVDALPYGPAGVSLRALFADVAVARVRLDLPEATPPPWYDCDTEADLRRAQRWT